MIGFPQGPCGKPAVEKFALDEAFVEKPVEKCRGFAENPTSSQNAEAARIGEGGRCRPSAPESATAHLMKSKKAILLVGLLGALAAVASPGQEPPTPLASQATRATGVPTIAVDEIERGQKGYGISVFEGGELQRFDVEIVGVLRNFNPGVSFILARLSGAGLESSGVIAGMSGSPVYVDDRLAGAVSFSWDFSTGALAGIMPIAAMRRLGDVETSSDERGIRSRRRPDHRVRPLSFPLRGRRGDHACLAARSR